MAPKKSGGSRWWGSPFGSSSRKPPVVITISSDTAVETDPSEDVSARGPAVNSYIPEVAQRQISEPRRASVHEGRHSVSHGGNYEGVRGVANQVVGIRSLAEMRRSASVSGSRGNSLGVPHQMSEARRASVSERRRSIAIGGTHTFELGQASSSRRRRSPTPVLPSSPSVINISSESSRGVIDLEGNIAEQYGNQGIHSPTLSSSYYGSESLGTYDTTSAYHATSSESGVQNLETTPAIFGNPFVEPSETNQFTFDQSSYNPDVEMGSPVRIGEPALPMGMPSADSPELAALLAPMYDTRGEELFQGMDELIYGNQYPGYVNQAERADQTLLDTQNDGNRNVPTTQMPIEGIHTFEEGGSSRPFRRLGGPLMR